MPSCQHRFLNFGATHRERHCPDYYCTAVLQARRARAKGLSVYTCAGVLGAAESMTRPAIEQVLRASGYDCTFERKRGGHCTSAAHHAMRPSFAFPAMSSKRSLISSHFPTRSPAPKATASRTATSSGASKPKPKGKTTATGTALQPCSLAGSGLASSCGSRH